MRSFDASTAGDLGPAADVLAELQRHATRYGIPMMVVGAAARDLLIRHVVGSAPQRATADVDIAIAVSSWPDVDRLTGTLQETGAVHRFLVRGVEVDVIPFGGIESAQRTITWSNEYRMNVFGFREALAAAVEVRLPGGPVVAVASLPAQSLLKLFAWRDRRYDTRRDAVDLKTIIDAYHQGPYLDELYAEHEALLDRYGFDPALAGAERMGREAAALVAVDDRGTATDLLFSPELYDALCADMGGTVRANRALLGAYRDGLR
jgi:predicted nucleotidyltransferase